MKEEVESQLDSKSSSETLDSREDFMLDVLVWARAKKNAGTLHKNKAEKIDNFRFAQKFFPEYFIEQSSEPRKVDKEMIESLTRKLWNAQFSESKALDQVEWIKEFGINISE